MGLAWRYTGLFQCADVLGAGAKYTDALLLRDID